MPAALAAGTALGGPIGAGTAFAAYSVVGTSTGFALGFWASRGPLECACFPRRCSFNDAKNTCQLELHDVPSENPFSTMLPMPGMKCAPSYKSENTCNLQQCVHEDY